MILCCNKIPHITEHGSVIIGNVLLPSSTYCIYSGSVLDLLFQGSF
jgi:hypothetical protein